MFYVANNNLRKNPHKEPLPPPPSNPATGTNSITGSNPGEDRSQPAAPLRDEIPPDLQNDLQPDPPEEFIDKNPIRNELYKKDRPNPIDNRH